MALSLISLFCVSCRDPGLMERITDEEAVEVNYIWNEQVGSYRPPGAMYCRECQVSKLRHFCQRIEFWILMGNEKLYLFVPHRYWLEIMIIFVHGQVQLLADRICWLLNSL